MIKKHLFKEKGKLLFILPFSLFVQTRSNLSQDRPSCVDTSESPYFPASQKHQRWKSGRLAFENMYVLTVRGEVKETEAEACAFR